MRVSFGTKVIKNIFSDIKESFIRFCKDPGHSDTGWMVVIWIAFTQAIYMLMYNFDWPVQIPRANYENGAPIVWIAICFIMMFVTLFIACFIECIKLYINYYEEKHGE